MTLDHDTDGPAVTDPAGARTPLVSVQGVSRDFGTVHALDDVSLEIHENEFFALLGPSGCGKTTLLRILAGFEQPDRGRVELAGTDLLSVPPHKRPVNLMFQSYALFPHMSVEKNVSYGLEREGLPRQEVRRRVAEVLDTVGLGDQARRRPHQLSGGQRQRVALARAIVKRPRLLLLDEPLSALDKKVRAEMQLELKRLQHEVGITFVVVTHDQEEAMSMADRIAVMHDGVVQQVDEPVRLYQRPSTLFVADFIGDSNVFRGVAGERGLEVPGVGVLPASTAGLPIAQPAWLSVRPENVHVVPEPGVLRGTVVDVRFYGGVSSVSVEVDGHPSPVLVTRPGPPSLERGSPVHLDWSPADAWVLTR